MFQNSTLSSAAVDLPQTLQQTGMLRGIRRFPRWLTLPRTGRDYLLWSAIMIAVAGLVTVQIWLSLQIAEAERTLSDLRAEYTLVEQENAELLWQISQYTALSRVQAEATRLGYVPGLQREYRWASDSPFPPGAQFEAAAPVLPAADPATAQVATLPWYRQWGNGLAAWWQPYAEMLTRRWQDWDGAVSFRTDR